MQLSRRAEWTTVIAMALVWGFVGLNRIGITYLFPILRPLFHLQFVQIGLLISGTSLTWALSSLIGGYFSDRLGFKPIYLICMTAAAVFSAFIGATWDFLSLFVVRDLIGLGDGVGWSVGQGIVSRISSPKRRAFNQGFVSAGYTIVGVGIGAVIITQLAIHFGWRSVFLILAIPAVILMLILLRLLPSLHPESKQVGDGEGTPDRPTLQAYFAMLRSWRMVVLILVNIVVLVWIQGFLGFASLLLQHDKYSLAAIGLLLTLVGLGGTIGQLILPYLSDLVGRKAVSIAALALSALCIIVVCLTQLPVVLQATFFTIIGFCGFGSQPIITATMVSENVPSSQIASALGVTNFFAVFVGATLVPVILGAIADASGIAIAILTIGIIQIAGALLTLALRETAPRVIGTPKQEEIGTASAS